MPLTWDKVIPINLAGMWQHRGRPTPESSLPHTTLHSFCAGPSPGEGYTVSSTESISHVLQTSWKDFMPLYWSPETKIFPPSCSSKLKYLLVWSEWYSPQTHMSIWSQGLWKELRFKWSQEGGVLTVGISAFIKDSRELAFSLSPLTWKHQRKAICNPKGGPHQTPILLASWSWTSSLQNSEK